MPSCGRVSLLHQVEKRRYVAHLLYAPALQRGRCLVIEDLPPLYHIALTVRVPQDIQRIVLIPDQQSLAFERSGNGVHVTVPEFRCHCAVVLEY